MRLDPMETEIRVGAGLEPWAAPFAEGLEKQPGAMLVRAEYGALAQSLAEGTLDCALIPPLTAFRIPFCRLVPGVGVCGEASAGSERLFSNTTLEGLSHVRVASSGRAMAEWARLMVAEHRGLMPEQTQAKEFLGQAPAQGEGLLLGGAEGLRWTGNAAYHYDLGAVWRELTGLPTVLQVWACRFRAPYPRIRALLWRARQYGEDHFEETVLRVAQQYALAETVARSYLGQTLSFSLASLEAESLRHLSALAHRHGMFDEPPSVAFC